MCFPKCPLNPHPWPWGLFYFQYLQRYFLLRMFCLSILWSQRTSLMIVSLWVVCLLAVCQSYLRHHFHSAGPAVCSLLQAGLRVTCSSERGAWDQTFPGQEQFQEIRLCTLASMGVKKEGWSLCKGLSISLHTSCIPCNGLRQLATLIHFIIFYF